MHIAAGAGVVRSDPTWLKLVRIVGADFEQGGAEVIG
jgi:hypothetical protein